MALRAPLFACSFALALSAAGCADDRPRGGDPADCNSGVAIVLEAFGARFGTTLPVTLRACFDGDCDVVRIVDNGRGPACAWDPGGPPAQLTTCLVRTDGAVEIDIARVDGKNYGDGARHVVAVAVAGGAGVLYTHAEEVRLVTAGDSGCYVTGIDLRP